MYRGSKWNLRRWWLAGALGGLCCSGLDVAAQNAGTPAGTPVVPVRLVQDRPPEQPLQPLQPLRPQDATTTTPTTDFGARTTDMDAPIGGRGLSPQRAQEASGAGTSSVLGSGGFQQASSDVGSLLSNASGDAGVEVQRRSPIITDPRVRGYHVGQLLTQADHGFFHPARYDIDTLISKFDAGNIRDVIVIKGPYTVRQGPGFAFLDIQTFDAPRYQCGFELHGITTMLYKDNSANFRGRQTVMGGDSTWGFRLGYSTNSADDYRTGTEGGDNIISPLRGQKIPSGFKSQNVDFAFSFDLTPYSTLSAKGFVLEQHDVELPGLFFDINALRTQAYSLHYEMREQWFDRFEASAWYNYTNLQGDSFRPSKLQQIPELGNFANSGLPLFLMTEAGVMSTGFQTIGTWGQDGQEQLSVGSDFRYFSQQVLEFDQGFYNGMFPVPKSHWSNIGLFVDGIAPVTCYWTLKGGVRVDLVKTDIDQFYSPPDEADFQAVLGVSDFDREFYLFSGHVSSELRVTDQLTFLSGIGVAQRPPIPTELYAFQPFIGVIQNSFNYVEGMPDLEKEKLYQFDLGMRWKSDRSRAGVSAYYAFINDYITYDVVGRLTNTNVGTGMQYVNTSLATLTGFEAFAEFDLLDWLTPFAQAYYTQGTDRDRGSRTGNFLGALIGAGDTEPLPGIVPLESRLGLRIHEPGQNPRWSVEGSARIVDDQDRIAASLGEQSTAGYTIFDIRGFWQVNDSLLVSAGVENLLDRFYREHLDFRTGLGVIQPGRTFYIGAELRY